MAKQTQSASNASMETLLLLLQTFAAGLKQFYEGKTTNFKVGTNTFNYTQLQAYLTGLIGLFQALMDARSQLAKASAGVQDKTPEVLTFIRNMKAWLIVDLAGNPIDLAAFGVSPPKKRTPPSTTTHLVGQAKAQQKRKAKAALQKQIDALDSPPAGQITVDIQTGEATLTSPNATTPPSAAAAAGAKP